MKIVKALSLALAMATGVTASAGAADLFKLTGNVPAGAARTSADHRE